jgi:hypothetical protein
MSSSSRQSEDGTASSTRLVSFFDTSVVKYFFPSWTFCVLKKCIERREI